MFRPQWIHQWQAQNFTFDEAQPPQIQDAFTWQGKLWYLLTKDQNYDPIALIKLAIENLEQYQHKLPKRIAFLVLMRWHPCG